MRIENVSTDKSGKLQGQAPLKGMPAGIGKGDSFEARVVRAEGENVSLRTADGQVIRARIDGDVPLRDGQQVRLTVSDMSGGQVTLTVENATDTVLINNASTPPAPGGVESDPALRPYVEALRAQGLPVTRETVTYMQALVEQNPAISLARAAFLAGNRISQEQAILEAATHLLDSGADVGDMLTRLAGMIDHVGQSWEIAEEQSAPAGQDAPAEAGARAPEGGSRPPQAASWATLVARVLGLAPAREGAPVAETAPPPAADGAPAAGGPPEAALTAEGELTQIALTALPQENAAGQGEALTGEAPGTAAEARGPEPQLPGAAAEAQPGEVPPEAGPRVTGEAVATGEARPSPAEGAVAEGTVTGLAGEASESSAATGPRPGEAVPRQPEATQARAAPEEAAQPTVGRTPPAQPEAPAPPAAGVAGDDGLARFAQVLEGAAREVADILALPSEEQAEGLKGFIDSLFARIDHWEADTPGMVKKAREELFVRLSLVREAVQRADIAGRPAVAEQTQRLMDHLKLLGQIEQFTYVQIPVQQGQEQKTAELYIYHNKKKSRRIDPENVRILLALDLQHMGHLQAFVAITGRDVALRLDVEQQDYADFFRSQTVALHTMLGDSGFRLTENRVQVAEAAVTVETAMETLRAYEAKPGGVDVKV